MATSLPPTPRAVTLPPCPALGWLLPATAGQAPKSRYFPGQRFERLPRAYRYAEKPLLKRFFVCRGVEHSNRMLCASRSRQ
jgi:hypothetical protein